MALMRTRMTCLILMFPTLVSGGCSAELSGRMLSILSNGENDYYHHKAIINKTSIILIILTVKCQCTFHQGDRRQCFQHHQRPPRGAEPPPQIRAMPFDDHNDDDDDLSLCLVMTWKCFYLVNLITAETSCSSSSLFFFSST